MNPRQPSSALLACQFPQSPRALRACGLRSISFARVVDNNVVLYGGSAGLHRIVPIRRACGRVEDIALRLSGGFLLLIFQFDDGPVIEYSVSHASLVLNLPVVISRPFIARSDILKAVSGWYAGTGSWKITSAMCLSMLHDGGRWKPSSLLPSWPETPLKRRIFRVGAPYRRRSSHSRALRYSL